MLPLVTVSRAREEPTDDRAAAGHPRAAGGRRRQPVQRAAERGDRAAGGRVRPGPRPGLRRHAAGLRPGQGRRPVRGGAVRAGHPGRPAQLRHALRRRPLPGGARQRPEPAGHPAHRHGRLPAPGRRQARRHAGVHERQAEGRRRPVLRPDLPGLVRPPRRLLAMQPVLVERVGQVQVVTINRPEARNAVDLRVALGIAAALDELDERQELRAGVVTGAGGSFSAGMDLKAFLRGELPVAGDRGLAGITRRGARQPALAALGGGFEIALACDLVVASRSASFGFPEVRRALIAGAGGLLRLPRRIPYHAAMELALTGEPLAAERAAALGLVNRLVEPGTAVDAALELAALVARGGPLAVEASKRILAGAAGWGEEEAWRRQDELAAAVAASHDAREGARAFAERRAPVWQAR